MVVHYDVKITKRGPIFNGAAQGILDRGVTDLREAVAERGHELVYENTGVFKNPTPFYATQLRVTNRLDTSVVNDGGVVYGNWLEGTGSRNKTTRFKGYGMYRKATQKLRSEVDTIADRVMRPVVARLNGRG